MAGGWRVTEITAWSDGLGWLLGDDGSGFWLGREAVRRPLLALQSRRRADSAEPRPWSALAGTDDYTRLVGLCYAERPTALGRYAPLVSAHADGQSGRCRDLAEAAAADDGDPAGADPEPGLPIVLAGSLLARPTPIAGVRAGDRADRPDSELTRPGSLAHRSGAGRCDPAAALGASWLALRSLGDRRQRASHATG